MRALARAWGLPYSTLRYRLRHGWEMARALTEAPGLTGHGVPVPARDHQGRRYPSLSHMARAWGVSPSVLSHRLNAGWTVERALSKPSDHSKWHRRGKRQMGNGESEGGKA